MENHNDSSAERAGGSLERMVSRFAPQGQQCTAHLRDEHKTRCPHRAIAAITEHLDYVPVCPRHAEIARSMGWRVGELRRCETCHKILDVGTEYQTNKIKSLCETCYKSANGGDEQRPIKKGISQ